VRIKHLQDAGEAVVTGNAVGLFTVVTKPQLFGFTEHFHVYKTFSSTDDGAQCDESYVAEIVFACTFDKRIFKCLENDDGCSILWWLLRSGSVDIR
jgi:hypothetical protein